MGERREIGKKKRGIMNWNQFPEKGEHIGMNSTTMYRYKPLIKKWSNWMLGPWEKSADRDE